MDIYCPRCGEPWDNDTLHDEADERNTTYREMQTRFAAKGCAAFDEAHNENGDQFRAAASGVLMEMMGDDFDGVAAMMQDAGF